MSILGPHQCPAAPLPKAPAPATYHHFHRAIDSSLSNGRSLVSVHLSQLKREIDKQSKDGLSGAADISEEEFVQFQAMCAAGLTSAEDSFYQHKEGLLNDAAFNSFVRGLKVTFSSPGMRVMWKRGGRRALGDEDFAIVLPLSARSISR